MYSLTIAMFFCVVLQCRKVIATERRSTSSVVVWTTDVFVGGSWLAIDIEIVSREQGKQAVDM